MIIDFDKIPEAHIDGFKGGKGRLVISGIATFHYDDHVEECRAGQCHYCPEGHSHYMENLTDHDLVYFAVVK